MTTNDLELFAKLLRLLASDNAGERAAAASKATQFLAARNLDWHSIVDMLAKVVQPSLQDIMQKRFEEAVRAQQSVHHTEAARFCLSMTGWTERERLFLNDMLHVDEPSERQLIWLRSLFRRYQNAYQRRTG